MVVVGDVDPQQVLALAKQYFGPIRPGTVPVRKPRREVEQKGMRRITVKAPAELPYLLMGYQVPVLNTAAEDWEPYALEVLSGILDAGDSARLATRLVRGAQIAAGAGAGYDLQAAAQSLFLFDGVPAQGHTVAELEQALRKEIGELQEQLVDPKELTRVKAQVIAGAVYQRDSIFYQAMQMGTLETVGLGWRLVNTYVARIRAVTAEQLRAVARKYLVDDRLTVAVLEPLPMDNGKGAARGVGGGAHDGQH